MESGGVLTQRNRSGPGYVYIMTHGAWSKWRHHPTGRVGAVKIGKTSIAPGKRAGQIAASSGLLSRPQVAWQAWVADRGAVERAVHAKLGRYRLTKRREMFAVSVEEAKAVIVASTEVRTVISPRLTLLSQRRAPHRRRSKLGRVRWRQFALKCGLLIAAVGLAVESLIR
jgi:hypothetical protein